MSSIIRQAGIRVLCIVVLLAIAGLPAAAAERTTPVTVQNLPGIDPNNNTVRAQQSGIWSVGVLSMPTLDVNTHAVTQNGAWNVGVTGSVSVTNTPNVAVTNTPTVAISSAGNTVKSPTLNNKIQLFTTSQTVADGGSIFASATDCSGYKELRIVVGTSKTSASLKVSVWFETGTGGWITLVRGDTDVPAKTIADTGNASFIWGGTCAMIVPVMSNRFYISVTNSTGASVMVYNWSYVYLVN